MTKEDFEKLKITGTRRSGNTTRIVDELVQEFFINGKCYYWDHAEREGNMALDHMLGILENRLYREHNLRRGSDYIIDKKSGAIILTTKK